MIELHAIKDDGFSLTLEEKLRDLVVAHKKFEHESGEIEQPFIKEGTQIYISKEEITSWFATLEKELKWQRSLSGDGCYIDPKTGKVC